jgi:hypothetical protein
VSVAMKFELEMEMLVGWTIVRANEHEFAAHVLNDREAVRRMETGLYVQVQGRDGERRTFRFTPAEWLSSGDTQ